MLDRHEEHALAEIAANLRADDPELSEALAAGVAVVHVHPALRTLAIGLLALALTAVTTLALGPNIGALVAVLSLSYAFLYGWQALRVCRGLRT
jgi:hypothetical protein